MWHHYSKVNYSVDSLNLEYLCNRPPELHRVLSIVFATEKLMYGFWKICMEVSLQNKWLYCRICARHKRLDWQWCQSKWRLFQQDYVTPLGTSRCALSITRQTITVTFLSMDLAALPHFIILLVCSYSWKYPVSANLNAMLLHHYNLFQIFICIWIFCTPLNLISRPTSSFSIHYILAGKVYLIKMSKYRGAWDPSRAQDLFL